MLGNRYQGFAIIMMFFGATTLSAHTQASEEAPSMELLEFIGEFQTRDGEWFNPLNLLDIEQETQTQSETAPRDKAQQDEKVQREKAQRDKEEQSDE